MPSWSQREVSGHSLQEWKGAESKMAVGDVHRGGLVRWKVLNVFVHHGDYLQEVLTERVGPARVQALRRPRG